VPSRSIRRRCAPHLFFVTYQRAGCLPVSIYLPWTLPVPRSLPPTSSPAWLQRCGACSTLACLPFLVRAYQLAFVYVVVTLPALLRLPFTPPTCTRHGCTHAACLPCVVCVFWRLPLFTPVCGLVPATRFVCTGLLRAALSAVWTHRTFATRFARTRSQRRFVCTPGTGDYHAGYGSHSFFCYFATFSHTFL